jgi:hypothetical protein
MSDMSPRRRKVVVLCCAVAALSGTGPLLLKGHRAAQMIWIALMVTILIYAIAELVKLKREEP